MKPKIIIVDNDLVFRQSLFFLISVQNNAEVVGKTSDGKGLIELLSIHKPDLILIDIDIPGMNSAEVLKAVFELTPQTNVIVFSMFHDEEVIERLVGIGVKGFFLKSEAVRELKKEIHSLRRMKENYYINNKVLNYFSRMAPGKYQVFVENLWIKNDVNRSFGRNKISTNRKIETNTTKYLYSKIFK